MAIPPPEEPRGPDDMRRREPPELAVFAHIEGLVGEEDDLLRIPAHERREHEHERLRHITEELDRAFEHLRERAAR